MSRNPQAHDERNQAITSKIVTYLIDKQTQSQSNERVDARTKMVVFTAVELFEEGMRPDGNVSKITAYEILAVIKCLVTSRMLYSYNQGAEYTINMHGLIGECLLHGQEVMKKMEKCQSDPHLNKMIKKIDKSKPFAQQTEELTENVRDAKELTRIELYLTQHCAKCGKHGEYKVCRCQIYRYCSKKCQNEDWPHHKLQCISKEIRKRRNQPFDYFACAKEIQNCSICNLF